MLQVVAVPVGEGHRKSNSSGKSAKDAEIDFDEKIRNDEYSNEYEAHTRQGLFTTDLSFNVEEKMRNYSSATKNIPIIYYPDIERKMDVDRFVSMAN